MAAPNKKDEQRFDQVKLQGMHEPLTVRVEKMRGNVRQPIELPPKGDEQSGFQPPGTNWTRNEVLGLENFVLTKWSGGGYYEFTVTDAKGDRMTWQGVWDPRIYAEKIPPNTQEAALMSPPPIAQGGPQMVPTTAQPLGMQMQTGWPPSSNSLGYNNPPHTGPVMPHVVPAPPQQQGAPAPAPSQAPPMWAPPQPPMTPWQQQNAMPGPWNPNMGWQGAYGQPGPYGMPPYGMPYGPFGPYGQPPDRGRSRSNDDDRAERRARWDREDEETKELKAQLQQAQLQQKELEYKNAVERLQQQSEQRLVQMQQQHAQAMQAMQDEIRRMGEGRNKGEDDEVRRMREEQQRQRDAAAAERAALERQLFEQRMAQERAQSEAQLQMLRDQLARMNEQPRGESEEFRRLRDEQERQAREFDRQRQEHERRLEVERAERERERERHERERRDEQLQRELKETREASERRFEQMQMAAQQSANASNPMIDAIKESSRFQAESQREIARMQADSANRMAQFMVSPVQIAQMMKENSNGTDGIIRNIIGSVGEIGSLYKNAAETIMNMSGGGGDPPAARLIQEGIGRASEVAERFLAVKRDQVISEGKVKQAEAMRDQTKIQAEAHLRSQVLAQQHAQQTGQHWSPPPPVTQAGGMNGAQQVRPQQQQPQPQPQQPANGNGAARPKTTGPIDLPAEPAPPPKTTGPLDHPSQEVVVAGPRHTGPSEEEVFGITLESVHRLRRGVAEGKLDPSQTIDAILKGVEHVLTNGLVIPAFALFQQERWADFVDLMLPQATTEFKTECVRILIEEVERGDSTDDQS